MRLYFPFLFFPAFVFYVNSLSGTVAGATNLIFVRILDRCKDDEGILQHELKHVEMAYKYWLVSFIVMAIGLYLYNKAYIINHDGSYNTYYIYSVLAISSTVYSLLYTLNDTFRFNAECMCYQVQCRYYDDDRSDLFADYVTKNYGTKFTKEQALAKIRDGDYGQLKRAAKAI